MSNGLWECPDCGEIVEQNKLHECQSVMSCPECGGSGRIEVHSEDEYIEACRKCGGSGVASVPPEPPTMSDERVVERALAFVREFKGDNRCSLNCLHSEALAQHVAALRAELAELHLVIDTDGSLAELPEAEQREAYRGCALDGAHALDRSGAVVEEIERLRAECARLTADTAFDLDAFSRENLARCEAPNGFNHKLSSWSLSDWMTATLGELGEAANVAKKLNRVRDGIIGNDETEDELRRTLASEIADAFIYLDLMAQSQGIRLSEAVRRTFDAKSEKIGYPVANTPARDGETLSDDEISDIRVSIRGGVAIVDQLDVLALCDTVAALRAELADARADKARLDWLESTRQEHFGFGDVTPVRSFGVVGPIDSTLRDAIDAARAASGKDASHE